MTKYSHAWLVVQLLTGLSVTERVLFTEVFPQCRASDRHELLPSSPQRYPLVSQRAWPYHRATCATRSALHRGILGHFEMRVECMGEDYVARAERRFYINGVHSLQRKRLTD